MENNNSNTPQAQFQFNDYIVEHCKLNQTGKPISERMNFFIQPLGSLNEEKNTFELRLEVKVSDNEKNFDLEMTIKGFFSYTTNNKDLLMKFICSNSPAIMFPYIRAYVSSISSLSGVAPIIMPTLNMQKIGETLQKQMQA